MNEAWKNDLITTRQKAYDFLNWEVSARVPGAVVFPPSTGPFFFLNARVNTAKTIEPVLALKCVFNSDEARINTLMLSENYRGKKYGLSLPCVKTAFGGTFEMGFNRLTIDKAAMDGPSFWLYLGALPFEAPMGAAKVMRRHLVDHEIDMTRDEVTQIDRIAQLTDTNPMGGLRALSQTKIKLPDNSCFKQHVLRELLLNQDLIFYLGEPSTRAILTARLGRLPPFRSEKKPALSAQLDAAKLIH